MDSGIAVNGSPADCVKFGLKKILSNAPDLILSGINLGSNLGYNIIYSGTVAAAMRVLCKIFHPLLSVLILSILKALILQKVSYAKS